MMVLLWHVVLTVQIIVPIAHAVAYHPLCMKAVGVFCSKRGHGGVGGFGFGKGYQYVRSDACCRVVLD